MLTCLCNKLSLTQLLYTRNVHLQCRGSADKVHILYSLIQTSLYMGITVNVIDFVNKSVVLVRMASNVYPEYMF